MPTYWQVTLIARDDHESEPVLTKALIEEGFRINPLPQFLVLHDVEAKKLVNVEGRDAD